MRNKRQSARTLPAFEIDNNVHYLTLNPKITVKYWFDIQTMYLCITNTATRAAGDSKWSHKHVNATYCAILHLCEKGGAGDGARASLSHSRWTPSDFYRSLSLHPRLPARSAFSSFGTDTLRYSRARCVLRIPYMIAAVTARI